ncbi:MAG: histidinol-phosphate transaminase [Eubacteriales bacterium]|nr:histidinol-phosphate transaminase [Eubacteriales bacterium]
MSWEDKIRKVEPYVAGEQPREKNIIKLNTNECPYPPAPGVQAAVEQLAEDSSFLRLYPDMDATPLVEALAAQYGVDPDRIFVGVGSDDVLALCFLTFFTAATREAPLLFPDITYSFYDVWADLYRIPYRAVPLREDFSIDPADYLPAQGAENSGIIFPNPNAPTGLELAPAEVERIIAGNPDSIVIVDEAYVDFGGQTALPLLEKYDNLLVVQTFSKSRAMAGARVGFAIGSKKLIGYLKDVKFSFNSYTMNLPAIRIGTAAALDTAWFEETTGKIAATRERFKAQIRALGFEFPDSRSNFVFARHPAFGGAELQKALRARGIIVRHFEKPRIADYLRITIGTDEQMDAVVKALQEILAEKA